MDRASRTPFSPLTNCSPYCCADLGHWCRSRVIRFNERKKNMTIRRVEIERLSVTSSKPFEVVVAALKAAVGQPDMVEFVKETRGARSFSESLRSDRYVPHSRDSIFDERLYPGQRLIPPLGNEIEVFLDSFNRLWIEFESVLATRTDATHNSGSLQDSKMFGDRLPGQLRTLCQLRDRMRLPTTQLRNQQ